MSFFISDAQAAAGGAQESGWPSIIIIVAMFVGFYFFMIRPQQKRQKEHQALLNALNKGDEVVTSGGIHGRIKSLDDQAVSLEISKGVEIKVHKSHVTHVLPKGTLKHV
jgi:preprotein translocase subunit YajC